MIGEEHVKTDVAPKREPFMITCHRVFSVADSRDVTLMVIGTIGALVTGVSGLVFLYFYGKSINAVFDDPNSIDEIAIRVLITSIFTVTGGILQFSCWTMVGEILAKKLKVKFVKAILSQEIGWFDQCGRGELATIVADLSGKLKVGLGKKLGDFIENVTMITLAFAYGFYISYRLTSVMIITFVFFSSSCVYTVYTLSKAHKAILSQYASAGSVVTESLMAIRTVTALNSQCAFIEKYRKHLVSAMQIGIEVGFRVGTAMGTQNMLYFFAYSLGFWYGGDLVADSIENGCPDQADITRTNTSCITGGEVLSVFFAVTNASYAVGQLSPIMQDFANVRLAVTKMFEIIERVPMIDGFSSSGRTPSSTEIKGRIEFKDVSFSYPSRPDVQIFKNLNLNIEHGQTVAIVGPSGVGKSTCMNMILRFYDPTSGQVLLDGFSTKDVNVRWLRAQIGYVGQEPILFAGSIADNILYGLDPLIVKEAKDLMHSGDPNNLKDAKRLVKSRVVAAAKLAYAHDFIVELPKGYDTNVGSSGTQMSGGQKQRIAIARALIKRPAVLLLDEATSALDNASEKVVQKSIDALHNQKDQTTIIIAHRLSTIRKADKIAVISREGCISEEGTHKQLKALNGVYAELVRSQLSLNKDDTGNEKDRKGEVIDDDPDLDDEEDISGM
jgi:ATP-binding cassette subfamily B (MDR/TAP) protein 1